nr:HPr family phosphocarrier protein [Chlamydia ibidis]
MEPVDCYESSDEVKVTHAFIVQNASGIHVRPASTLVKLFEGQECEVIFTYEGKSVNARSVMSILMLGVPQGGEIFVHLKGKDALHVLQKLQDIFAQGFGEL